MNKVVLVGRLTKDPDLRFAAGSGNSVSRFTIAVNRQFKKDETDFIKNGVEKVIKAIYEYDHSIFGILEAIKTDYSNLDLNASEIQ